MKISVISCYYNFCSHSVKLENFKKFAANIKSNKNFNFTCVEFNPFGLFEIKKEYVDNLIQLSDGDIMWQKERLLNIALNNLDKDTDIVLACDNDLIFDTQDLYKNLLESFKTKKILQCFSKISRLSKNHTEYINTYSDLLKIQNNLHEEEVYSCLYSYEELGNFSLGAAGYLWAFDFKSLQQVGFFEKNIIGSGDRVTAYAMMGFENFPDVILNKNLFNEFTEYKNKIKSIGIKKDDIGYIDLNIYHLFHGETKNRSYGERHSILNQYNFNPNTQLIRESGMPFKFTQDVTNAFRYRILDYFYSRKEMI